MADEQLPWWRWFFFPLVVPVALVVLLPLGLLALLSIPYFLIFPDRHAQLHDFDGTPHQRGRIAQWRHRYSQLGLVQRIRRACARHQRKRNVALGQLRAGDRAIATYGAQGRGGQFILVLPELQMVAVFTGWNDGNGMGEQPFDMLQRFVLPAALPSKTTTPR